jgi:hypothetical protein
MRADAASVSEIVFAMEKANNAAMKEIVAWVVDVNRKGMIQESEVGLLPDQRSP